tara:strand:+ start:1962 stop:2162 length:201 start_codon:yes stop_codon:yes gene_type:complete
MSVLNNLVNQKVIAGTVLSVDINDFYFHEKGEPIYITVSVNPNEDLPEGIDLEDFHEIPLSNIRKA